MDNTCHGKSVLRLLANQKSFGSTPTVCLCREPHLSTTAVTVTVRTWIQKTWVKTRSIWQTIQLTSDKSGPVAFHNSNLIKPAMTIASSLVPYGSQFPGHTSWNQQWLVASVGTRARRWSHSRLIDERSGDWKRRNLFFSESATCVQLKMLNN